MTYWQGKKVLITGAGGFIGSHLLERLIHEGAQVRAFVRYNSRNETGLLRLVPRETLQDIEIIPGDLRDADAMRNAARGVDTIFHLGALIAIPYSYRHPREVIETNIMGTLNVLMAALDLGTRRVINTSTSEVYGTAQYTPIDEDHRLQGQSPYAASKIGADKIAESFYRSFNLPVVTLRPFNTFGPRQSARAVIPTIISQALTRDTLKLGSLDTWRDFTYVSDTAEAYLKIAQAEGILGEEIHLGTNRTVSIRELVEIIYGLLGKTPNIISEEQRQRPEKSEVMKLHSTFEKAQRLIGWQPQVTLEDGLRRTIDWIADHPHFFNPDEYAV